MSAATLPRPADGSIWKSRSDATEREVRVERVTVLRNGTVRVTYRTKNWSSVALTTWGPKFHYNLREFLRMFVEVQS